MTVAAQTILTKVARILNDAGGIRWPEAELLDWLNEGIVAICIGKPSANVEPRTLALVDGVEQAIDADMTGIVRVLFSIGDSDLDQPGFAPHGVKIVDRHALDMTLPGWMDPAIQPYDVHVDDVAFDPSDPRLYYVSPGNDGDGALRVLAGFLPVPLTTTTDLIPLADEYAPPLTDYVCFRCFSKDSDMPGSAGRAGSHAQLFASAIGIKISTEALASLATTRATTKP